MLVQLKEVSLEFIHFLHLGRAKTKTLFRRVFEGTVFADGSGSSSNPRPQASAQPVRTPST